ncbi:MAG: Alpha-D-kanosaminyltransferase [Syntrophus sp. PtaB.Bin075]|nr:MAG: Alpha-D-kanosaminyltransferase [Syntrophus sp. PtaB.Bin075]
MRAMNLSNALVEAGHKVILWSSAFYHQEKRHRSSNAKSIRVSDNLEIRLIPSVGYQSHIGVKRLIDHVQLALNLKKMLLKDTMLPDAAFIGFPPIETAAVLSHWLAKRGVPSVLDVKDQWPSFFLDSVPGALRPIGHVVLWPYFYLARRAMRDATCLTAMANDFLDWALRFAQRERTGMDRVFPLTSPLGQVSATKLEEARQWWDGQGINNDGRSRVCFVGSLSPAFDFKPVREAAEIAARRGQSPCEFVVCGDGGSSTELRAMMAGLPNVHFPGWINRPKIEALAERCQAALAPYLNIENFTTNLPNKIIDALSLGLPILSPLKGEVASLISGNDVGMSYGTDTGKTLHDCIQAITQDPSLQKRMSQRSRTVYAEQFSFEMVYGGLVKHLEVMASRLSNEAYR